MSTHTQIGSKDIYRPDISGAHEMNRNILI